jgi:hypothetical protein
MDCRGAADEGGAVVAGRIDIGGFAFWVEQRFSAALSRFHPRQTTADRCRQRILKPAQTLFIDLVTLVGKLQNSPRIELRACNTFLKLPSVLGSSKIPRRSQDMSFDLRQTSRVAVAFVLATVFALPQNLAAETASHLVSPSELQQAAVKASAARQQNRDEVQQFFSSEQARGALQSAHMNPEQVKTAVSTLDDAELAQLASRVHRVQANFAGGTLSDRDLIIIIVAIAALILIIVAVR